MNGCWKADAVGAVTVTDKADADEDVEAAEDEDEVLRDRGREEGEDGLDERGEELQLAD